MGSKKTYISTKYIKNREKKNKLIRQVYDVQKEDSKKGDFAQLVQADAELLNMVIIEEDIEKMTKEDFQKVVKSATKNAAFAYLLSEQEKHSKYKDVRHTSLQLQPYLFDHTMSQDDIQLLFAMRTKTVRGIHSDFGNLYGTDLCPLCQKHIDTIPALMECQEPLAVPRTGATFEDIYSPSVDIQRTAVHQFRALIQARERIQDWEDEEV